MDKQYFTEFNGYFVKDTDAREELEKRAKWYYVNNTMTQQEIQNLFNNVGYKIIEFEKGNYTFNDTFILNENTKIILNNSNLTFTVAHAFRNFISTDTFLSYNGNGNISIIGGNIIGGACSFCHSTNILFEDVSFINCLGAHILEMMSINDLKVNNCIFKGLGIQASDRQYVEYIQIDDCTYDNFPWFSDTTNITYDGTPNINWFITNNKFLAPTDTGYDFYTAIGGHTALLNSIHSNINVINNIFDGFTYAGIRFRNVINSNICDNYFKNNSVARVTNTIVLQETIDNIKIERNINDGNGHSRFLFANTPTSNIKICDNEIFNMITPTDSTTSNNYIIYYQVCTSMIIDNNIIRDVNMPILRSANVGYDENNTYYTYFKNNTIKANSIIDYITVFDANAYVSIINNNFDIASNSKYVVRLSTYVNKLIFKNNKFNAIVKASSLSFNGYAGDYQDIDDVLISAYSGNTQSIEEEELTYPYEQFNTMVIVAGTGNYTQYYKVRDFSPRGNLTARTYRFGAYGSSVDGKIALTLGANNTFSYSCTVGINLRAIYLLNEIE